MSTSQPQPGTVNAELATGTKLEVDLEHAGASSVEEFFKKVETGQVRWVRTKADLPSLLNVWHIVRFEVKHVELKPIHLVVPELPAADEDEPPRFRS